MIFEEALPILRNGGRIKNIHTDDEYALDEFGHLEIFNKNFPDGCHTSLNGDYIASDCWEVVSNKPIEWDDFLTYMERHYKPSVWNSTYNYVCVSSKGNHYVKFYKNGEIHVDDGWSNEDITIAEHRTYEQMLSIVKELLK